jgi:chemotaxis protein MotB
MKFMTWMVAGLLGLLVFGACSNSDEVIAEKDKAIQEKAVENDALKKRIADADGTNLVARKQVELKQAEIDRLKEDAARKAAEVPAAELEKGKELGEPAASPIKVRDPDIEVETRANGEVVMRVNSKELFASGSADLTGPGQKVLMKVADTVKKHPDYRISVEGHTDDTPLKKTAPRWKNNLNLSIARAISVRTFLNERGKIPESRMSVVGHGDTKPLVHGKTEEARARNRRVEIVLSK